MCSGMILSLYSASVHTREAFAECPNANGDNPPKGARILTFAMTIDEWIARTLYWSNSGRGHRSARSLPARGAGCFNKCGRLPGQRRPIGFLQNF
jgi:hypothetical protein